MKLSEYRNRIERNKEYQKAKEELKLTFEFADAVLRARLNKGWTQSELAREVGTKQANISRIEAGLANPTLKMIQKICEALNLDPQFSRKPVKSLININYKSGAKFSSGHSIAIPVPDWPVSKYWDASTRNKKETERITDD